MDRFRLSIQLDTSALAHRYWRSAFMSGIVTLDLASRQITACRPKAYNSSMDLDQDSLDVDFAPLERVLVVRQNAETGQRESVKMQWGLVPSWAESPAFGNRLVHARAETVATKPAFREAFRRRRCLIVVDSFQLSGGKKRRAVRMKDGRPFGVGGIGERWLRGEEALESCAVITTAANALVRPINDRMPVIIVAEDYARWLDPCSWAFSAPSS